MTTWCKIKTEKLGNQIKLSRLGGFKPLSEKSSQDGSTIERRDGSPRAMVDYSRGVDDTTRALIAAFPDDKVTRCNVGTAKGLQKDIGTCGKRNATRSTKCYGNGERRKMGLGYDVFMAGQAEIKVKVA